MQLGENGLPRYSDAFGALAAPPGAFVLRSSLQAIQLKSVFKFRKYFSILLELCQFLTRKLDPCFHSHRPQKAINRGARDQ